LPAIIPTYQKQGSEDFEDEYFYQYTLIDFAIRFFKPSPLVCLLLFFNFVCVSREFIILNPSLNFIFIIKFHFIMKFPPNFHIKKVRPKRLPTQKQITKSNKLVSLVYMNI